MKEFVQTIRERARADLELSERLKRLLQNCPEGRVQVTTANGYPRFYWVNEGHRHYIRKSDLELAKELMNKAYYKDLLRVATEEAGAIQSFLNHFDPEALTRIYETMHEQRKRYIDPLVLSDELFARNWLEELKMRSVMQKNSYPIPDTFQTVNGEYVRSKSEKMILDMLQRFHIFYVYEAPLVLGDTVVFPDVTALNLRKRKTIYWEHCGMMDNPDYANDTLQKIDRYERSGFFIGDQLIISMESSKCPLSTNTIERLIQKHLL